MLVLSIGAFATGTVVQRLVDVSIAFTAKPLRGKNQEDVTSV